MLSAMMEIEVEIDGGLAEDLSAVVSALWTGATIQTEDDVVRIYPDEGERNRRNLRILELTLHALEKAGAKKPLVIKTWEPGQSQKPPQIVRVGNFLIVREGMDIQSEEYQTVLKLIPSQAFGSGKHPTSALCLTALEEFAQTEIIGRCGGACRLLDVGTGSGLLSLAAASLTGCKVLAVDQSPQAVDAAKLNARLNGLGESITIIQKELIALDGTYDFIMANLMLPIFLDQGIHLETLLAPQGTMIISGFAERDVPRILKTMLKPDLVLKKAYSHSFWSALVLARLG